MYYKIDFKEFKNEYEDMNWYIALKLIGLNDEYIYKFVQNELSRFSIEDAKEIYQDELNIHMINLIKEGIYYINNL